MNGGIEVADVPLFMANRVLDNIFVGGMYAAEDEDFIHTNHVERIINCCYHRYPNRFGHLGVRYLNFSFEEDGSSTIFDSRDENITLVVRFLQEAVEADDCVLIASANGDSRSVILLAGYLIHRFHWPCQRALQFITTKRFNAKPHPAYLRQLIEFANRRKAKYGAHKDIFGSIRGLKLNQQEYLHRNTFLNSIMSQPPPEETVRHKSIRSVLGLFLKSFADDVENPDDPNQQNVQKNKRHVVWRDTLTTSSTSYQPDELTNGQQNALFRPRNPSYKSMQQIRCVPVRLDVTIPPSVSFDLPTPGQQRRSDGYLSSKQYLGYAVCARPVSILRNTYKNAKDSDEYSTIVRVEDYEKEVIQELKRISEENASKNQAVLNGAVAQEQPLDKRRPPSVQMMNQSALNMQMYRREIQAKREAEAKLNGLNTGTTTNTISIRSTPMSDERHNPALNGFVSNDSKMRFNDSITMSDGKVAKLGPSSHMRPPTPPKKTISTTQSQVDYESMKQKERLMVQKGISQLTVSPPSQNLGDSNGLNSSLKSSVRSTINQPSNSRLISGSIRDPLNNSSKINYGLINQPSNNNNVSQRFYSVQTKQQRPMSVSTGQIANMRNSATFGQNLGSSSTDRGQYRQITTGQNSLGSRFTQQRPHSVKVQPNSTGLYK